MNDVLRGRIVSSICAHPFIFVCMEWLKNMLQIAVCKDNIQFDICS